MWIKTVEAGSCVLRAVRGRLYSTVPAARLTNAEISQMRVELFNKEKERQLSLQPRIEKIEVKHVGKTAPDTVFVMNKGVSTPYNCTMHLSEWYGTRSVLALVDGELWDMYKPLTKSCTIQFLTFKDENPEEVNKAYWRSCAMILGSALEQAFKDEYMVTLVRAPEIPVISGAFCYDVVLDSRLDDWKPTRENLHSFTKDALGLIQKDLPFEPLEVEVKIAREIFQHNAYKLTAVEEKASQHPHGLVTLHRLGDFVDLTEGPHIPRTSFCLQYEVTAVHSLPRSSSEHLRRFQGLSLPRHLQAYHTVWAKLRTRSQRLVTEEPYKVPETAS
ncbi:39S ribosomal protein L39, mitochondrial [Spea bombifrons]|uniref:39S ribosomal protein L39, mitochondrial n=1 Tax=Spea bombifrons TaxID=233779 RepID=UPI00234B7241|nr:39S ribosomal protein L39, mitochondrial [Spea bombifrons]